MSYGLRIALDRTGLGGLMRTDDLLELLRTVPFQPFRICLSDGAAFEVNHPDMAIVLRTKVTVAVPGPEGPDGPAERTVNCALAHITRSELLNGEPRKRP